VLAWTNLYKVAPAAGWNPGADLQVAQRPAAIDVLRAEIAALRPRRLLFMTGLGWLWPFGQRLGFRLERREGLVEAVGLQESTAIVVARHPMAKPQDAFVSEVSDAFARLGRPLAP
jgi:hypothetical protein